MTRRTTAVALAAVAMLGLGACSSGGQDTDGQDSAAATHGNDRNEAAAEDMAQGLPQEKAAPNAATAPDGDDAGESSGGVIGAIVSIPTREIIYVVDLSIATDDVDDASRQASSIATTAGGFVADERTSGDDRATITLKVPADDHADAVAALEELGDVTDRSRSAQDVTQEVVDTESRIESQRASIARIRALLGEATELSDVISIESELARREADLDALLSRQEQLAGLTSMATITVSLHTPDNEPEDEDERGFLAGLERGWDAFVSAGSATLTAAGAALPFIALLAIVGAPAYVIVRRRLRARSDQATTPDQSAPPADAAPTA